MIDTIFVVQGFEKMQPTGTLDDVVTVEVYAKNENEAIKKAKAYVKKRFYRIYQVIEKKDNATS